MRWLIFLLIIPGLLYILDASINYLRKNKKYIEIKNVRYPEVNHKVHYGIRKKEDSYD